MTEAELLKRLMLAISNAGSRIFRNHVGVGWQGETVQFARRGRVMVEPGDVLVRQARPLRAGLCVGSSDLVGWTPHTITAADLGRSVSIFTSVEAKSASGRLTPEQTQFLAAVRRSGGIAIEARDIDLTVAQINEQRTGKS
jgi:hypothetical protein